MTLNLPDRIGTNVSAAAQAARLQAAADAAIRHSALSASVGTPDRGDYQAAIRSNRAASAVRASEETGTTREDRGRATGLQLRKGPNPLFLAQMLAQDSDHAARSTVTHADAASSYPSLESDIEIFLPGEDIVFVETASRVDIYA